MHYRSTRYRSSGDDSDFDSDNDGRVSPRTRLPPSRRQHLEMPTFGSSSDSDNDGRVSPRTFMPSLRNHHTRIPELGSAGVGGVAPLGGSTWNGELLAPLSSVIDDVRDVDLDMQTPHHIIRSIEDILESPPPNSPAHRGAVTRMGDLGMLPQISYPRNMPISRAASFDGAYLCDRSDSSGGNSDGSTTTNMPDSSPEEMMFPMSPLPPPSGSYPYIERAHALLNVAKTSRVSPFPRPPTYLNAGLLGPGFSSALQSSGSFGVMWPAANGAFEYVRLPGDRYAIQRVQDRTGEDTRARSRTGEQDDSESDGD
ncbi:hypothetical protein LTR27_012367 [Elasticomyces elasticus]|nr:hypothetical protein LTR27_012367 [Elasticomyces elasticus]